MRTILPTKRFALIRWKKRWRKSVAPFSSSSSDRRRWFWWNLVIARLKIITDSGKISTDLEKCRVSTQQFISRGGQLPPAPWSCAFRYIHDAMPTLQGRVNSAQAYAASEISFLDVWAFQRRITRTRSLLSQQAEPLNNKQPPRNW